MNEIYRYTGYAKQSFHQKLNRQLSQRGEELLLLPIIAELRNEHPGVAARQLYWILRPSNIGRDRFEKLCFENGFKLEKSKAYKRTTDSNGVIRFPNLVAGVEFTYINQAWSSDITYYQIGDRFYYLTFIIDLFSRRIVGYSVSESLTTEQTSLPALQMAVNDRCPPSTLIFHSDGGGQYYSKAFLEFTKCKLKNSMCEMAYENPNAERINGTIKNQYLKGYNPLNYSSLIKMTQRAVYNYNTVRPHKSLKKSTPVAFEEQLSADSTLLKSNDFCIKTNTNQQYQKNHQILIGDQINNINPSLKTVNVF